MRRINFHLAALLLSLIPITAVAGDFDSALINVNGVGEMAPRVLLRRVVGAGCTPKGAPGPDLFALSNKFYGYDCMRYALETYENGVPVFRAAGRVTLPVLPFDYPACFTAIGNKSALFWIQGKSLRYAFLDEKSNEFIYEGKMPLPEMEKGISSFAVDWQKNGMLKVCAFYTIQKNERPGDWRSAEFRPYDATGVYMGKLAKSGMCRFYYSGLENGATVTRFEALGDFERSFSTPAFVNVKGHKGFIACNNIGGIYFFEEQKKGGIVRHRVVDREGNAMRNISCAAQACLYTDADGSPALIVTGEGAIQYYSFFAARDNGDLVYKVPVAVKEINPPLSGGTLVVPTSVDWDGDGALDIIAGNSMGNILFFKNHGSNANPVFTVPEKVKAGGETIHVQPGYGEDIQGPGESRWGYLGPNVYDWNGDGIYDILTNDSRGKHNVYMGRKTGLCPEHPFYLEDLPLHGMWRCRPGVGKMDGKTAYVTLDDDDEFHLYFREDDYNLLDGGKLLLSDGRRIRANHLEAGAKGRVRFEIVDWDADGVKDLLISTNKHAMIPADDPAGLPWSNPKELKGSTILFMKNVGSEKSPSYAFPRQLKYDGMAIRLGHHGCGACATMMGPLTDGLPNILVCDECGNFYLFERSKLTW